MSTISYPRSWNAGDVLTAADLDAQFNAVNTITGILPAQLGVGVGVHAFASGTFVSAAVTTVTTVVTTSSLACRGGTVICFGGGSFDLIAAAPVSGTVTWRLQRDGTNITGAVWTAGYDLQTADQVPLAFPAFWAEVPSATGHIYTVTLTVAGGAVANSAASGMYFAVEFA